MHSNAVVHRKQDASEEILQCLKLLGCGKVSKVGERQNEIRLIGDASKDFQEKKSAGCKSTTLPTVPGVEVELPLKCYKYH